jgi:hypothetical protein
MAESSLEQVVWQFLGRFWPYLQIFDWNLNIPKTNALAYFVAPSVMKEIIFVHQDQLSMLSNFCLSSLVVRKNKLGCLSLSFLWAGKKIDKHSKLLRIFVVYGAYL